MSSNEYLYEKSHSMDTTPNEFWKTAKFSLPATVQLPETVTIQKNINNDTSSKLQNHSRSVSPDWSILKFSLPESQNSSLNNNNNNNNNVRIEKENTRNSFKNRSSVPRELNIRNSKSLNNLRNGSDHSEKINRRQESSRNKRSNSPLRSKDFSRKRSSRSHSVQREIKRFTRSISPDWDNSKFSLSNTDDIEISPVKNNIKHEKSSRSLSVDRGTFKRSSSTTKNKISHNNSRLKMEENNIKRKRSRSPDWNNTRFSFPNVNRNNCKKSRYERDSSPDWKNMKFSLPNDSFDTNANTQETTPSSSKVSIITNKKSKYLNRNSIRFTVSQKTLDKLLPKPEICLYDIIKYGPTVQQKDDFLLGLNLMRNDILNKISLLKYKKKLRNIGKDFMRDIHKTNNRSMKCSELIKNFEETEPATKTTQPRRSFDLLPKQIETVVIEDDNDADNNNNKSNDIQVVENTSNDMETIESSNTNLFTSIKNFNTESLQDASTSQSPFPARRQSDTVVNSYAKRYSDAIKQYEKVTNDIQDDSSLYTKLFNNNRSIPNASKEKSNKTKKNIIRVKWPMPRRSLLDFRM